jgi:hypothetical protein
MQVRYCSTSMYTAVAIACAKMAHVAVLAVTV